MFVGDGGECLFNRMLSNQGPRVVVLGDIVVDPSCADDVIVMWHGLSSGHVAISAPDPGPSSVTRIVISKQIHYVVVEVPQRPPEEVQLDLLLVDGVVC